ncbi:hypothetical protein ACN9OJ_11385, partial [Glaesserella parasuis]|uniref:hypothetical protein n=1 Tax=Glaesserella parasuis TaxID=738 RepID=UPI003B6836B3
MQLHTTALCAALALGGLAATHADTLAKVAEVRKVSVELARTWGFWHDEDQGGNPFVDEQGLVEVPMWRH